MTDSLAIYECKSCDNYILSTASEAEITCCGSEPRRVEEEGASVELPEEKTFFRQVFGMTETEMSICLCVIEEGESTASDISDALGVERSVVSRYANHLVELGFLHKSERNLRSGGRVHVYEHATPEEVTRSLTLGFYRWAAEGTKLIDDFERKKMEQMAAVEGDADVDESIVYWD